VPLKKYPEVTVGALVVNARGEILLCKSRKWKNKFVIPGGHVELGETLEHTVKREVKEETGLSLKSARLLGVQEAVYSKEFFKPKHFIFIDFLCEARDARVRLDERELQAFVWVKPRRALRMKTDSFTKKTIKAFLKTI
jgi:nucleoside triphosphatase